MRRSRLSWGLRALAGLFFLALVLVVAARGYLSRAGTQAALKSTLARALEQRLGPVSIGDELQVSWTFDVSLGPVVVAPASPVVRVERVHVSPSIRSLWRGKPVLHHVVLEGVVVEAGEKGRTLLEWAERLPGRAPAAPVSSRGERVELPEVRFRDVRLRGAWGGRPIELSKVEGVAELRREAGGTSAEVSLSFGSEGAATLSLSPDRTFRARWDAVPLAQGEGEGARWRVAGGRTGGALSGALREREAHAELRARVEGLRLVGARLSAEPIELEALELTTHVRLDREKEELTVRDAVLRVRRDRDIEVPFSARVWGQGERQLELSVRGERLAYNDVLGSLPVAFVPGDEVANVAGAFAFSAQLKGSLARPAEWALSAKIDLSDMRKVAATRPPWSFGSEFVHQAVTHDGQTREVVIGPTNPAFTPLDQVPPVLVSAVLLSEDSMFLTHQGFDFAELKNNLLARDRDEKGQVLRGASTISQQLAKNLFLSREKTYARKAKEALITLALEASLPKQRLLEMYLNLIEWGPGLNGIGEAARHYFDKPPSALNVREAVFLATIIPNPIKYHVYCARGALTETWEKRVSDLLYKMHGAGMLTDEELQLALHAPLRFTHPKT